MRATIELSEEQRAEVLEGTPNWIDAHCHLSDSRVSAEPVLQECRRAGISRFVLGGVNPEDWERQGLLARAHPGVFFKVFGAHPWWIDEMSRKGQSVAIGEAMTQL